MGEETELEQETIDPSDSDGPLPDGDKKDQEGSGDEKDLGGRTAFIKAGFFKKKVLVLASW